MGLMGLMLYWLSCRTAMLRNLRRGLAAGRGAEESWQQVGENRGVLRSA